MTQYNSTANCRTHFPQMKYKLNFKCYSNGKRKTTDQMIKNPKQRQNIENRLAKKL